MSESTTVNSSRREKTSSAIPDEEAEREHFQRILQAFRSYRAHSLQRVAQTERYLLSLPQNHQKMLRKCSAHLEDLRICIENNSEVIRLITKDVAHMFENVKHADDPGKPVLKPTIGDMEKVQVTLKQFVRDWSSDGKEERDMCYQPIIDEVVKLFPSENYENLNDVCVLVPGAGLGRLAYEIAKRGFTCQGNEFSLFMLFASNFILNRCRGVNTYSLHPWIHCYVNNLSHKHQTKRSSFPDADPSDLPPDSRFSMAAGDFLEVYVDENMWNCVATCFFIDCANNVVAFLETIFKILKPGGVWINLGPLLYHFSDIVGEQSLEPSFDILREIIVEVGFEIEKCEENVKTKYSQNPKSMFQYQYNSVFMVCRKPMRSQDKESDDSR